MHFLRFVCAFGLVALGLSGCGGGGSAPGAAADGAQAPPAGGSGVDARLHFAAGFSASVIANVPGARELAALPNGDLLVGTLGTRLAIVPAAEGSAATTAQTFATLPETRAAGVALGPNGSVYAATNTHVWKIPYAAGDRSATGAVSIARVRTGAVAPHSDGDVHVTTSIAVSSTTLYAGVGSSCNACVEVDPTRAAVLRMQLDGSHVARLAQRVRNPIALALNPATGALWIGGAGQDNLPYGHPYEYFDSPTHHGSLDVDYGWPACEENRHPYNALHVQPTPDCSGTVVPAIAFPAYSTLLGAAFYPATQTGAHAFPAAYRGGLFVTSRGSWHCCPSTPPRVYFVPMNGDAPATPVDWSSPSVQSREFVWGFGSSASASYIGRPSGIAIGASGSLFFADDATGNIYRIRPS